LLDAQRALRWTRCHGPEFGVQPDKVGILGFSAGGHLASTTATHFDAGRADAEDPVERVSCRPDAVILCYAVVTFVERLHQGSMLNLLGTEEPLPELRAKLSAELCVNADTMPHFLWHTAEDGAVPLANSLRLADALSTHGVPVELHVFPYGQHGLGLAPDWPDVSQWTTLCAGWLGRLGFAG
ncbi:MAG: alpha/beta hydrolase, partial [Armatimonadetes bacterium]|nr:alpha/beta hydrolase [Armatimonadota bacterium]